SRAQALRRYPVVAKQQQQIVAAGISPDLLNTDDLPTRVEPVGEQRRMLRFGPGLVWIAVTNPRPRPHLLVDPHDCAEWHPASQGARPFKRGAATTTTMNASQRG